MAPERNQPLQNHPTRYRTEDIQVLSSLEPIRRRPGMYIGFTGADGLRQLLGIDFHFARGSRCRSRAFGSRHVSHGWFRGSCGRWPLHRTKPSNANSPSSEQATSRL